MAIRNLVLNLGSGSDVQAVSGHILINRHTAGSTDAGLWIFDSPERVVLTNPARTVPLEVGVAYKFDPVIPEGTTIYAYMTAGAGNLNYLDLVPVDPSTLLPGTDPGPAWTTALDSTNAALEGKANTVDVYDKTTSDSRYGTAKESTQRLMSGLHSEKADLSMLFVGDSTGNETSEWIYLTITALAAQFPRWTVEYLLWNDATVDYASSVNIQTGSGSRTLTVYNCSVAGADSMFFQGGKFSPSIAALDPVLTVVSMGHNESAVPTLWLPKYTGFAEQIADALPSTDIILVAQNPATANTYQEQRTEIYREVAAKRGYGFIDVCQAFLDTGDAPGLTVDGIHPTPTGSALWRDTVLSSFVYDEKASPRTQPPSTLSQTGEQLLVNGDFAEFGGAIPDGWTGSLTPTVAKDSGLFESANGYSVKITAATTGGSIQQLLPLGKVKGKWVTLAVRVYVTASQGYAPGRVALGDSLATVISNPTFYGKDGWRWEVVTKKISTSATFARVTIYGDTSPGTGYVHVSEAVTVLGKFPKRAANGQRGLSGAAGVLAGQLDFVSTVGGLGAALFATTFSSNIAIANDAILIEFRPFRDISVNELVWFTGATSSGNYDIGILGASGGRLWSKGSTPWPTASSRSSETVSPPVAMTAGTKYYLVLASDAITGLFRGISESFTDQVKTITGGYLSLRVGSSFPIPSSLTPGAARGGRYPVITVHGT